MVLTQPDASPRVLRSGLVLTTSRSPLSPSSQRSNHTATASARPDRSTANDCMKGACGLEQPGGIEDEHAISAAPSLRKSISSTPVGPVSNWCLRRPKC